MGIVIVTVPGKERRMFANSLYKKSGGKVDLVIIQKSAANKSSRLRRIKSFYDSFGLWGLFKESWYALLLRLDKNAEGALGYFRERSGTSAPESGYLAKTMAVSSANDDEVFEALKKLSPKLMVIWGSTILKPHILKTAERAINLHLGLCPYYRGAVANQCALINREPERVGATIHYAGAKVDSGNILLTLTADTSKKPRDMFRELNDRIEKSYLEIACRLFSGEKLSERTQDNSLGKNFMLKDWTPSVRYKLARDILRWEKSGALTKF